MKVRGSYLIDETDLKFFCLHGSHYGDLRFASNCQNLVHVSTRYQHSLAQSSVYPGPL